MSYLRKRGKKWYYTIELDTGGKRQRIERVGGRTKAEAEKARAQALAQYTQTGRIDRAAKITYGELADEWENDILKTLRPMTQRNYRCILRKHILPTFGQKLLSSIRPRDIQALLNQEAPTFSTTTINTLHTVLVSTFDFAVFCEYMSDTPMRGVKVPEAKPVQERKAFTKDELQQLISHLRAKRPELLLPVLIAYHTGARCGEVLALTWADLNLEARTLSINKTRLQDGTMQATTKTKTGTRTITIGAALIKILKTAHAKQAEDKMRYGKYYRDSDRICRREDGTELLQVHIKAINNYCRKTFGHGLCFHSLRHTHATMLLEAGEDLELVSKRLGHANISTTARVYSHVLAKRQQTEREILDQIFL